MRSGGEAFGSSKAEPSRFPNRLVCIFLPFLCLRFAVTPIFINVNTETQRGNNSSEAIWFVNGSIRS